MSRAEWIASVVRTRLAGRAGQEMALRHRYERLTGRSLPLDGSADGMTQMMFQRMIAANRAKDTSLAPYVDKYRMREYVAQRVGREVLVPLIWSGVNPMAIPVNSTQLPGVLKTNHMSQDVLVMRPGVDPWMVRRKAVRWMSENYYWIGGEYQYRAIRPRLMLEQYLDDGADFGPRDYSLWCFHGEPLFVQVRDGSRELRQAYDLEWKPLAVLQPGSRSVSVQAPGSLERMTGLARRLAQPFSFVRVDFYDVGGRPYLGELTFTPASGRLRLSTPQIDLFLGDLLRDGRDAMVDASRRLAELAEAAAD